MLVLTRKLGQKIIINEGEITITLISVGREKVKLGIDAPAGTRVDREEVHNIRKKRSL